MDIEYVHGKKVRATVARYSVWEKYILKNLTSIWKQTNKIMAFNLLNQNERKIKQGLYYTNKNWIKDICEQNCGKTEIIFSSILPDDILIIVKT